MQVPLLDLKLQYESIKTDIMPSIEDIINQQKFILGPVVENIEQELASYCGTKYAVGVSSGTDALLLSLMAIDIQPGDTVITTPYTFFATVGSICRLGALPRFVDIDPSTYNIDPVKLNDLLDSIKEKEKVKAVIPVHLYGQCADMEPIVKCAQENDVTVIEDAAQALGATYKINNIEKKVCSIGDLGCTSFFPSKNLGCFGDGGMIMTDDEMPAKKLKSLRVHGQAGRYEHKYIGMNGRLDALQAGVLHAKLPYLDSWIKKRRGNAAYYEKLFQAEDLTGVVKLPDTQNGAYHTFNQFVIRAEKRDALKDHLEHSGIGCAIYYPLPLHLQECYEYFGYGRGDFPESEKASQETLALPIFPELTREQIEYVVEKTGEFYKR